MKPELVEFGNWIHLKWWIIEAHPFTVTLERHLGEITI